MRCLLIALCWLLLAAGAWAQDVVIGDQVLMRLNTPEEAEEVTRRIEAQLDRGASPAGIRVLKTGKSARLVWGDSLILEVTPELARSKGSEPVALASRWARGLRELVDEGLVKVSPARIVMPVGEERSLEVGGLAEGPVTVEDPYGVVAASVDEFGAIRLRGLTVGKTRVKVARGNGRASVFVHVKDWAGTLPDTVTVQVAGDPAPGGIVADAVLREAYVQARVRPGCTMQVGADLSELPNIPRGQSMRVSVPIRIEGNENYYPVQRTLPVSVTCLDLERVESNLLLVSNRPERVDQDGVLLQYTFSKKEPTRLMYSHLNASKGKRNLWVNLSNPNGRPVKALVSWTYAGPSRNEVLVGHSAALRLVEREKDAGASVLTFPAGSSLELAAHELGPLALVSGFATFRILDGESLNVEVRSELAPSLNDGKRLPHLGAPFNPFKIHPHGVFAQPFFEEEHSVQAGGAPVQVLYGESPWLIDFETGLPNTGNFGVFYRYEFTLRNPRANPARFGLFFDPVAGPAAGTFLIDRQVREASFRKPANPELLGIFDLAPGEERIVKVLTLPEASSNYPARLTMQDITGKGYQP
ncbi:MAG: hypothetical protein AB1758_06210 [Candidatus Eremiobacterota bacterium]